MKPDITTLFFIVFALALLTSCGDSTEKMKKQYIEACADGNFSEARKIVEKMEANVKSSYQMDEHWKYVNDKEIYFLLQDGSRDASNRIMFLFNSTESSQLPYMDDVLEVAVSQDNEYLAMKLINGGVRPNKTAAEAAADNKMEELIDLIIEKEPSYILNNSVGRYYKKNVGEDQYRQHLAKYADAAIYVNSKAEIAETALENGYNEIVDKLLASDLDIARFNHRLNEYVTNNPNFTKRLADNLLRRLNNAKKTAPIVHRQGLVPFYEGLGYATGEGLTEREKKEKYKMPSENAAINAYNNQLSDIYNDAVNLGRKDIALQVANAMKPTIEAYSGDADGEMIKGIKVDGSHYLIHYNYDEINNLKQRLK